MESVVLIGLMRYLSSPVSCDLTNEEWNLDDAEMRQSIIDSSDRQLPLIADSADPSLHIKRHSKNHLKLSWEKI